ncbi:MAG: 50S ribosomal protein L11 methyltransferase [Saprospiraceae bacterium]
MDYYKFEFTNAKVSYEILLAFLGQLDFDCFEEEENALYAYLPKALLKEELLTEISALKAQFPFDYQKTLVPSQNWNKDWEANFKPILIDDFCLVRADFHEGNGSVEQELIINPKMAFGTAHHETTYSMIKSMRGLDWKDKNVLDYGCGTGILAILAAKLGANPILAIDIEEASYENTLENAEINQISNIEVKQGDLNVVEEKGFELILANINRNVILASLPALYEMLVTGGQLMISGFRIEDQTLVETTAKEHGFIISNSMRRNEWLCQILTKQ